MENTNMPTLSVERIIELFSGMYSGAVKNKVPIKTLPSVMLWGPPGVGKSQAVRQIGKEIEKNTKKEVRITDVRLLLFNPIDLRGIPTANADKTLAIWLKPQIFQMDPSEDVVNILFLDEISAAPQSVQAAAYQITLDRVVGEHKLPDNCIVIAAGNRVTDKSVSFKMPKALANRLMHLEVEGSFDSWLNWATRAGVNENVIAFLSAKHEKLFGFDAKSEDLAFATPRSWEMVSNLLNGISDDAEAMYPMIAGLVGCGNALEFRAFCKMRVGLPDIKSIFFGKPCEVPKATDVLYSTVSSMTAYAKEHKEDEWQIGNSLRYAAGFPADFVSLLLNEYEGIDENYQAFLMNIPEYYELAAKRGRVRNGET